MSPFADLTGDSSKKGRRQCTEDLRPSETLALHCLQKYAHKNESRGTS